jgi:hypothetical protein
MCKVMKEVPFLKTLEEHGVPVSDDSRERMDLFISRMKNEPGSKERLEKYAAESPQSGGATIPIPVIPSKDDFLGPEIRWIVDVMGSPYMVIFVRMLLTVIFFVSYLEELPVFGGILSAVLDLMVTGGRVLIKVVQRFLPPMIGLVPLPFMGILGMAIAGVFGMLIWPIIAIISFSRQEFTTAIEAMFRALPPPIGDTIADAFLDTNRTAYRMNEKRKKIVEDIVSGLRTVMNLGNSMMSTNAGKLSDKLTEVAESPKSALTGKLGDMKGSLTGKLGDMKSKFSDMKGSLTGKLGDMKSKFSDMKGSLTGKLGDLKGKFSGGQALSRKPRKKNKWRTRRQPTK